ncbi:exopolygalacturonase-like [Bidens hawaiensis]|uniref:exopolygalacturonase-like n=1 Tax=Bidens hawaiensis TaxID=980011 RepID=UPI0040499145
MEETKEAVGALRGRKVQGSHGSSSKERRDVLKEDVSGFVKGFGYKSSAVAITFVLSLATIGFMVLFRPRNLITTSPTKQFDVNEVGLLGETSDTLETKWNNACASGSGKFVLSTGNSPIGPLTFRGPCKGGKMEVDIIGTVTAIPKNSNFDTWISFHNVENLHISGSGGKFDGQGSGWWNTCKKALAFHNCPGLFLDRVTSTNSQRNHLSTNACDDGTINDITVIADKDSPNTDGIDISATNGLNIVGGNIGTGDDCIAINAGSFNINITDLHCGPGHGISVGSLGRHNAREYAGSIRVIGATFTNTQNGVWVKTVPEGSGSASEITFSNIEMTNVQNPITLTHSLTFSPHQTCDKDEKPNSVVHIKDVTFYDIHGTCTYEDAINIHCAKNPGGCVGITLNKINIRPANPSGKVGSICKNVDVKLIPPVIPSVNCVQTPDEDNSVPSLTYKVPCDDNQVPGLTNVVPCYDNRVPSLTDAVPCDDYYDKFQMPTS